MRRAIRINISKPHITQRTVSRYTVLSVEQGTVTTAPTPFPTFSNFKPNQRVIWNSIRGKGQVTTVKEAAEEAAKVRALNPTSQQGLPLPPLLPVKI